MKEKGQKMRITTSQAQIHIKAFLTKVFVRNELRTLFPKTPIFGARNIFI